MALKCIPSHFTKDILVPCGFTSELLAMFDGVYPPGQQGPVFPSNISGIFQGNGGNAPKPHLSTPTLNRVAEHPLASAVLSFD